MARYTVLARTFINGSIHEQGSVIDYDGQPGSTLQPMDTKPSVKIPDDWQTQNGLQRIALARSLGAPKQRMSAADADLWIENEVANRKANETAKPAAKLSPFTTPEPKPFGEPFPGKAVPSTPPETT